MHEFSICQGLVEAVLSEMRKVKPPPRQLLRTRVVVGELRQVVPHCLSFAYETLTKGTPAEGSALDIARKCPMGKCRKCSWGGQIHVPSFRCPECGSHDIDVEGGDELYLESIEVENDE